MMEIYWILAWLVVYPLKNIYTLLTVFFYKYIGANYGVTNYMSQFYMFVTNKDNLKFTGGNMGHFQVIGIILCYFINLKVTLTILSNWLTLSVMLVFKMLRLNLFNIVILWNLRVIVGGYPTEIRTFWTIFKLRFVRVNTKKNGHIVVPTVCDPSKHNYSQLIHQDFCHVLIDRLQIMAKKGLMKVIRTNISYLEEYWPICLLTKTIRIPRDPNIDSSNFSTWFLLQMDFTFFNVKVIRGLPTKFLVFILTLHTPLGFHTEANNHLYTYSN